MTIWNNELHRLADGIIYNLLTVPREKVEVNLDVGAKMTSN